jgi:hypothetical protein
MTSFKNFSLEPSIQKVLTNVQTGGAAQQITGDQSIAASTTTSEAHSSPAPPTFDAVLQEFMATNKNFEIGLVGEGSQQLVLVDKNLQQDQANSHFGAMSWTYADGSTLTLVGILQAAAHSGVHVSG